MTGEARAPRAENGSDGTRPTLQPLLEMLRARSEGERAASGAAFLRQLLAGARLAPEHEELLEAFLSLQEEGGGAGDQDDLLDHEQAPAADLELRDLREVNDTLAAALGACPFCWGGDDACEACHGRGSSGFTAPDLGLFRELVVPAVRTVKTMSSTPRSRSARARREHGNLQPRRA